MKIVVMEIKAATIEKEHTLNVSEDKFVEEAKLAVKMLGLKNFYLVSDNLTKEQFDLAFKGGLNPMEKAVKEKFVDGIRQSGAEAKAEEKITKQCEEVVEMVEGATRAGASDKGDVIEEIREGIKARTKAAKFYMEQGIENFDKLYQKCLKREARFDEIMNEWTAGGECVMAKVKVILGYIIKVVKAGVKFVATVVIEAIKFIAKAIVYVAKKVASVATSTISGSLTYA